MKWFLAVLGTGIMLYPTMFGLMVIYGLFEKLVHAVDRKELSQKQLEKILWIISMVIDFAIVLFIMKQYK